MTLFTPPKKAESKLRKGVVLQVSNLIEECGEILSTEQEAIIEIDSNYSEEQDYSDGRSDYSDDRCQVNTILVKSISFD